MVTLTNEELDALTNVIDYMWEDEQADFKNQDEDGQTFHIFGDLGLLHSALDRRTT